MKAVGYFVEGAKRNGHKRGIGDQNRAFLDFCSRQGYEVAGTFLDTADPEAPGSGFRQMLSFLQRADRGFTVVAVDSLGVLGADLGEAAMKLLTIETSGVTVVSVHTAKELAKELVETWAERGDETPVSERVRAAMRRKAVKGEVLGRPPYGYHVGPRRRLELVPDEAVVVRYIFRLYLQEGLGIRKIAGKLNEEGILTRRGGRWSMVSVRDLLRNRVYLGTYTRFGVKIPGSHAPLVSQEDFRQVQERLQSRSGEVRERTVTPFLLSGLLYCARCGNRMIGVSRRQKWKTRDGEEHSSSYRYYQCESRTNQSSCGYNTQRAQEIEARVRAMVAEVEDSPQVRRVRRAGNVDSYVLDLIAEVDRIEARMRKTRRQLEEIVADTAHGHLSLERMRALGSELAKEQQDQAGELAAAKARLAAHQSESERHRHLDDLRARLTTSWDEMPFAELQRALREVVDRVDVDGDESRLFLRP
ncbi:MAG: recombinase family protein [Dehalococcoidia bacterium]|nr:recombinase family protein [Dehalococcoidia bacterium]